MTVLDGVDTRGRCRQGTPDSGAPKCAKQTQCRRATHIPSGKPCFPNQLHTQHVTARAPRAQVACWWPSQA
eukprot:5848076-Amphidinium_carterae.1